MGMPDKASKAPSEPLPLRELNLGSLAEPFSTSIVFDEDERAAIAAFLGVVGIDALRLEYTVTPIARERFQLDGSLTADLTQSCVITLDPVPETISEKVEAELWPEAQIDEDEAENDPAEDNELEEPPLPIVDGKTDLAAFAIEIVSSTMAPYPRKTGAEFNWVDPASGPDGEALSPFADLKKLKPGN